MLKINDKKRIVIIGSSGFIGSSFMNIYKNKNVVGYASKDINLLDRDTSKYKDKVSNNDTVVFISAEAPCKDEDMLNRNVLMAKNFFKITEKIRLKKLIYISSDAVFSDSMTALNEESTKKPNNFHGKMHVTRENIFITECKKRSILLTILRPTLVFGPGDTHNGYGPNKFIRAINKNENITLFGKGEEKRDHIFIEDVIKIIIKCIENDISGSLNIVTGKVFSFHDIAQTIIKIKGTKTTNIKFKTRIGDMPHKGYRAFDNTRILKYFPNFRFTSLKTSLNKTLAILK